jgi:hypothetical protein
MFENFPSARIDLAKQLVAVSRQLKPTLDTADSGEQAQSTETFACHNL